MRTLHVAASVLVLAGALLACKSKKKGSSILDTAEINGTMTVDGANFVPIRCYHTPLRYGGADRAILSFTDKSRRRLSFTMSSGHLQRLSFTEKAGRPIIVGESCGKLSITPQERVDQSERYDQR